MHAPTIEAAREMGRNGSPVVEAERLAFEAWVRGHGWALDAEWVNGGYIGAVEKSGHLCSRAMLIRMMWAAWRDRAALAQTAPPPETDK